MRILILLFAISRLSESSLPYHGVTVGFTPYSAPVNSHSQYHAQDIYGQYAYGYASDLSSKDEVKTADGITRGGYSYIDANGILQTVQYVSDPVHGFRVIATNLPRDLPEVEHARAQHLAQFEYIKAEHAQIAANQRHEHFPAIISPVPPSGAIVVPVRAAAAIHSVNSIAPIAFSPPVIAVSSQYHAQDGLGQYSYGYSDPLSAKSETKSADGVTRGGYSYIDANGILQTVQYVSDPVNGFRVAATNLPVAPSVTLIGPKVTTSVVGPKDNNVAVVAAVPTSDTAITPAQSTHIDSIEQNPTLAQANIVPNANVPFVIQSNPNQETPVVFPNHELPIPFHPPLTTTVSPSGIPHYPQDSVPYSPPAISPKLEVHSNYPSQILLPPENHIPFSIYQSLPREHIPTENHQVLNEQTLGNLNLYGKEQIYIHQNPHEQASPSGEYRTSYEIPLGSGKFHLVPINTDTINNGPINQQVLNHGATGGSVADGGEARVAFVPGTAQQVYHLQAPVGGATQVGLGQEHTSADVQTGRNEGLHVTAPTGYYTQNIQY